MLILVKVRAEGDALHVDKNLWQCSVVLSSLGKCIAQVQTSTYRTSTAPTASNNARGESLPAVVSTEEYKTAQSGRRKEEKKTESLILVSCVLSSYYSCQKLHLPWCAFPKEGSLELLWQLARFIRAAKTHSRTTMWGSSKTKGNRYNKRQKRIPLESGKKKRNK